MGHVRINDDTGPVGSANPMDIIGNVAISSMAAPSTFPAMGVQAIGTAGTREALSASSTPLDEGWIQVTAWAENTDVIYVGDVTIDNTGYRLDPGLSVLIRWNVLSAVYVDAVVSGEGVSFVGW